MRKILATVLSLLLFSIFSPILVVMATSVDNGSNAEKPKLIFGDDINYPPFSYLDDTGQPAGFNVELAKAVGNAMGYEVEVRLGEWSSIREALNSGEINAISGMFYSEERKDSVDFSSRYLITNGDIFMKDGLKLTDINSLKDQTVVVQKGDFVGEYLKSLNLNIQLVEVPTVKTALLAIKDGEYQYAGLAKLPGIYTLNKEKITGIYAQGFNLAPSDYSMAVKKGNESLLMTLDSGLQILKATGEYQKIYHSWLGIYEEVNITTLIYKYRFVLGGTFLLVFTLVGISILLNQVVKTKTKELQEANSVLYGKQIELETLNSELECNMEELITLGDELRKQNENLLETEKRLRLSEERNRNIVNALPDLVFTFDSEGRFIDCQAPSDEMLLSPKSEFIGKRIEDIMPTEIAQRGIKNLKEVFLSGELRQFEYTLEINGQQEFYEMRLVKSQENEVIGITRNISNAHLYLERIKYLSYNDQLTGLYNRRFFEETLQSLDEESNLPFSIIMADINGLKLTNDAFGHSAGDKLLIRVATILKKEIRSGDVVARIGGDEFVILLPKTSRNLAEGLVKRIYKVVEEESLDHVVVSLSIGIETKEYMNQNISEVFSKAEEHMYRNKIVESQSMRNQTIKVIIKTMNETNIREKIHSEKVSQLSRKIGEALHLDSESLKELEIAGLMHDIGKIALNENVLNKAGKLTETEYEQIKRHPEIGYQILKSVDAYTNLADYVLSHHERWDGKGYPRGLSSHEIPLMARIISVADTFEAMTGERPYRKTMSTTQALEELKSASGTQLDPSIVEIVVNHSWILANDH